MLNIENIDEKYYKVVNSNAWKEFQEKFQEIGGDSSTIEDRIQLVESFNFTDEQKLSYQMKINKSIETRLN